jgi:hypothetical protein
MKKDSKKSKQEDFKINSSIPKFASLDLNNNKLSKSPSGEKRPHHPDYNELPSHMRKCIDEVLDFDWNIPKTNHAREYMVHQIVEKHYKIQKPEYKFGLSEAILDEYGYYILDFSEKSEKKPGEDEYTKELLKYYTDKEIQIASSKIRLLDYESGMKLQEFILEKYPAKNVEKLDYSVNNYFFKFVNKALATFDEIDKRIMEFEMIPCQNISFPDFKVIMGAKPFMSITYYIFIL